MANTSILFPQPCNEDWDRMRPEGRARSCAACDKQVHDLSAYTPEEADLLLKGEGGPACVRATIQPDGRVATMPGRGGKFLVAAVATPALLLAAGNASASDRTGAIAGSVAAPVAGVRVTAVATGSIGIRRTARPNQDGVYHINHLPPGQYRLMFAAPGGRRWTVDHIVVHASQVTLTNSDDPPLVLPMVTAGIPALPALPASPPDKS